MQWRLRFSRGKGSINLCVTYPWLSLFFIVIIILFWFFYFANYYCDYDIYHWVRNKSIWKKMKTTNWKKKRNGKNMTPFCSRTPNPDLTRSGDFDASLRASLVSTPSYQTKFKMTCVGEQLKHTVEYNRKLSKENTSCS